MTTSPRVVWIAEVDISYGPRWVHGVFSSLEKAREAVGPREWTRGVDGSLTEVVSALDPMWVIRPAVVDVPIGEEARQ